MLMPQNSGLIHELFQGAERGRAFGVLGATIGLATAAGPVIGGLILAVFTGPEAWRWVFYVKVPICLVALVLAVRFVPRLASGTRQRTHLDLVGSLLLGAGVLSLLLPLVNAESGGLRRLWPLFGLALLLMGAFARWELRAVRRGRQPLLDPRLARTSGYAAGAGIGLVYFLGFTGIWSRTRTVLSGRTGLLTVALGHGRDPVRARRDRISCDRWPAGAPGRDG
jgi:MFS family permease